MASLIPVKTRESARLRGYEANIILHETTRMRRAARQLAALEADNFQEDPQPETVKDKKLPKFLDAPKKRGRKKKVPVVEIKKVTKERPRKTLEQLIEEDNEHHPKAPNYSSAQAGPSKYPARHLCAVCGFLSSYTCVQCGARYCCSNCLQMHRDTRCLKWTV